MALKNNQSIQFSYHEVAFRLRNTLFLKSALAAVFTKEGVPFAQIRYIFCTDKYLLQLNQQFLSHDTYTDILTFSLALPEEPVVAEIYISTERVQENADGLGVHFTEELCRVMIHGILHLCGHEDDTVEKKKAMRRRENLYLKSFAACFT